MKYLLLLVLICNTANTAQAENWITLASDQYNRDYDYDHDSITHHDLEGKVLVVWHRQIQNRELLKISRTEFHCSSLSYRTVYSQRYQDGDMIFESTTPQAKWQYATPTSIENMLENWLCKTYK